MCIVRRDRGRQPGPRATRAVILAAIATVVGGGSVAAVEVRSLGEARKAATTVEGSRAFSEQIMGTAVPDRFGTTLPDGLAAGDVERLLRPAGDTLPLNTLGVRSLAGFADTYAALLCTGGDVPRNADATRCEKETGGAPPRVHLGILKARPGEAPHLIAGPIEMDAAIVWRGAGLDSAPDDVDDAPAGASIRPARILGFDPAAYALAPGVPAFGVRGGWTYGYSGGFSSYEALYLFTLVEGRLRRVFAAPMSAFRMTAGAWNRDGTREHEVGESANLLLVLAARTRGHADLLLKSRQGKWRRTFRWCDAGPGYC
ncbi:hypothetical protein [uncultured Methylobacterium sp.]|jgi:hypothetical protein|uniref:hypothetical protein n=1 Tax=uncultured Methylobacterium sp. TaxID=157278 RepID=UPI0026190058|nr:hypothetical protein [uncultured Methylobacterium sp.]